MNPAMRLTCLDCGSQVTTNPEKAEQEQYYGCICGKEHVYPEFLGTGTRPNEWAAHRSRARAFRASRVVKDIGSKALWASAIGVLFFPLSLIGIGIGLYVLGGLPPKIRLYSGYRRASLAVIVGLVGLVGQGVLLERWMGERVYETTNMVQETAVDEMAALLRAQRLFYAEHGRYGSFEEIPYTPLYGDYCIYLSPSDVTPATATESEIVHPLPMNHLPFVSERRFLAIGLANLDEDPQLDIWVVSETGRIVHEVDDTAVDISD